MRWIQQEYACGGVWAVNICGYKEGTVTDYVNLDMMGINWHGIWALSCYIGPGVDPDVIDQKLVESFDVVAWWATMTFLTLDQESILNVP